MKRVDHTYRIATYMFLTITAFFFVIKGFGLDEYSYLRFFNIFIIIFYSNKLALLNLIEKSDLSYLANYRSIFVANAIAIILSSIGLFLYLTFLDTQYLSVLEKGLLFGNHLDVSQIIGAVFIEGMASSVIVAFGVMQYWKNERRKLKRIDIKKFLNSKEVYK